MKLRNVEFTKEDLNAQTECSSKKSLLAASDLFVGIVFFLIGFLSSMAIAQLLTPLNLRHYNDLWFQADPNRVMGEMIARTSDHSRSSVHPLFALLTFPFCQIIAHTTGMSAVNAAEVVLAVIMGLWAAALYGLFRTLACAINQATILTCIGLVSASAIIFGGIPETYPLGSLSIILALTVAAKSSKTRIADPWFVGVVVLTLAITVTNALVGLAATFFCRPWRRAATINISAIVLLGMLAYAQRTVFPSAALPVHVGRETAFLRPINPASVASAIRTFIIYPVILPHPNISEEAGFQLLSVEKSEIKSLQISGRIATTCWLLLLILGIWSSIQPNWPQKTFSKLLALCLGGQLVLHLVYGSETFLYSLHFLPLLLCLSAFALLGRARKSALWITCILLISCAVNNLQTLNAAVSEAKQAIAQSTTNNVP